MGHVVVLYRGSEMNLTTAVKTCFRKYASFQGRAPRSEYWFFVLFAIVTGIVAMIADTLIGTSIGGEAYGFIYLLTALALIVPSISVAVRRLHDTDRSGWWYWLVFLPLVGGIVLLVWFCQRGSVGENQYGGDPLDHLSA
jgi:uncharacterized membrane protein YhaH (DUF805 family)